MTFKNLPKILEQTLASLLQDSDITSWIVRGGPDFTQLSIWFSNATIGSEATEAKYRRASNSRNARDKFCAQQRQDTSSMNMCEGIGSAEVRYDEPPLDTGTKHSSVSFFDLPPQDKIEHVSPSVQLQHSHLEPASAKSPDNIGLSQSISMKPSNTDTVSDDGFALGESVKIDEAGNADEEESDDDGTFTCDGCGAMMSSDMGMTWYKCTDCIDIDICTNCWLKDIHSQHKQQMFKFRCPRDWNPPYCDSCGYSFPPNNYCEIFKCEVCEDFCLCIKCRNAFAHMKHTNKLRPIGVLDYVKEIC